MRAHLAIVIGAVAWHSAAAHAAQFAVSTTADSGAGSLRFALMSASSGGTNTINISATGTIELTAMLPALIGTLTINGPGANNLTIHVNAGTVPVFVVSPASAVQISGVTISGGTGDNGGGIDVVDATSSLALQDSVVSGNKSVMIGGAAVYSLGQLTIKRCTITGNTGKSVVFAGGTTLISDTTISGNTGTALTFQANTTEALTVDRVTISGNAGPTIGVEGLDGTGGFELRAGSATISNSTFSGNAGVLAGDFWTSAPGVTLALVNVTAADGSMPALRFDNPAGTTVSMLNTIMAGTGTRCGGAGMVTSRGHNLSTDTTCNLTVASDLAGMDPMLDSLADNGGPTQTRAFKRGSPAANAGGGSDLDQNDQRGYPRVQFGTVDIGAIEASEPMITQQPVGATVAAGGTITLSVTAQNQHSTTALVYQWRKDGMNITGATSATFTKTSATVDDSGTYDVLVGNEGGDLPSMTADVTVGGTASTGGGCCSASGGAGSSGLLALLVAATLGYRRRSRAANQRRAG